MSAYDSPDLDLSAAARDDRGGGNGQPILELAGVSKHYGRLIALDGVGMRVERGEVHCLAGENGSGKSTLIRIISGVTTPDPGAVMRIDGRRYSHLTVAQARRLGIQVIHQHLSLFPNLTVEQNIAVDQLRRSGILPVSKKARRLIAEKALAPITEDLDPQAMVGALPVAKRQLVAICRALAAEARVIFMDEPTASLAHREVVRLLAVIRMLSAQGIAIVFVSHRLQEVTGIANAVTVLRDGRSVGTFASAGMTEQRLAELMTGAHYRYGVRPSTRRSGVPVLSGKGLTRKGEYRDLHIDLHSGEIVGLIGRIGAGRTEFGLSLFGMTRPDAGTMQIEGKPYMPHSNRDAIDRGVAYLSEDRRATGLVLDQPISTNIALAVLKRVSNKLGVMRMGRQRELVGALVARLSIKTGDVSNHVDTLSGGNQQRVAIAKWVATEPKVLVLDSPTVGVDIKAKDAIYAIIEDLARAGVAILLISDEIDEVYHHADRVLVMADGSLTSEFTPALCTKNVIEDAVYA